MSKKILKKHSNFLLKALFAFGAILLGFTVLKTSIKTPCANSISCIKDLSGEFDPNAKKGEFLAQNFQIPSFLAAKTESLPKVLGEVPAGNKRIEVDLTNQMLYAYQNDQLVMNFPVSSGKWYPTPTGTFHIWIKLKYTRMSGGEGADAYDLPNVPWVMFFYNDKVGQGQGFSLHGAYWHNNFGHPMSHGCVNISPANAQKLFDWASPQAQGNVTRATDSDPGTTVVIYGDPPVNEQAYR